MENTLKFGVLFLLAIGLITIFLPVELYDGYAVLHDGAMVDEKLSLSYLVNKTEFIKNYEDMGVVDIRLKPIGWILVAIVNIGLPFLLGYRVSIAKNKKEAANEL